MNLLAVLLGHKPHIEQVSEDQKEPEEQEPDPVMWHCANCLYWQSEDENRGTCRFHAPFPEDGGTAAVWPRTQPTDWCGDWGGLPGVVKTSKP